MQKRYAVRLLKNLLSELDIEEELSQIGYYPIYSLWDVSKFLKYKNIKNFIIELEVDNTTNLIFPFLCQNSVGVIVLVQSKCPDGLWVYNPILNRNVLISYASFNTKYGNKLLLLEKIETNYSLRKKSHSNVYIYLHFTIPLVLIFIFIKHEYFLGVIGIINSLGFALSLAYTRNEFGARTPLFDIVCNSTSSCSSHDLYNSKIPFSLLSLVYFSLNIGFVLLSFAFNLKISNVLFIVLASIGILFSIISLLYQYFILKSFCKICLSISALVLIYFLIVIKNNSAWELDGFTFFSIFGMIIFGFIATLIVKQYRTLLKTLTDYNMLKNKTFSIWTNKEVIDKMLIISNPSIVLPSSTIEIGNPNGSIKLILILNSECKYCLDALWHIGNLSLMNDEIRLIIVVKYAETTYNHSMMNHLIEACKENDFLKCYSCFNLWKSNGSFNSINNVNIGSKIMDSNNNFFEDNHITSFPMLFVGDKMLPSFIELEHFKVAYS